MFKKIDVNGPNTHDVFKYLKWNSELKKGNSVGVLPWNFSKFLVDRNGNVVKYCTPHVDPKVLTDDIEALLK